MRKSLAEIIFLSLCKLRTFFVVPSARIVRFPIDIRGKKFMDFGRKLTTGYYCRLEAYPIGNNNSKVLKFGDNVQINDFVHIAAAKNVEIGNNVLIASKIFISDICHGEYADIENMSDPNEHPNDRKLSAKPVIIHDDVWIGEMVSILPGVEIGKGSIIGANSVVTKSIPEYSIAAGNPAKVIKQYNFNKKQWKKI